MMMVLPRRLRYALTNVVFRIGKELDSFPRMTCWPRLIQPHELYVQHPSARIDTASVKVIPKVSRCCDTDSIALSFPLAELVAA